MFATMPDPKATLPRPLLMKLAAAGLLLLVAALLVARGVDLRALLRQGLAQVQQAGPVVFFGSMAVLPAIGAPLSPFSLTAGSIFAGQLGMPWVIFYALLAITCNMLGTYLLASRALRPPLERLVRRLGYKLPEVESGDVTDLIVLIRVTPGVPFLAQNYLLGLAQVPLGKYLLVSCAVQWSFNAAFIVFGDALLHGKGKFALFGLCALIALVAGTHMVRKHYERRRKTA